MELLSGCLAMALGLVHLLAGKLTGLLLFHSLDRTAHLSRRKQRQASGKDRASTRVCQLHMGAYAISNAMLGYLLLHCGRPGIRSLPFSRWRWGGHFLVNDHGLRGHHKDRYDRAGRWVLAAGIVVGWLAALVFSVPWGAIGALFTFLAGGVILDVLKEELPEDCESSFGAFVGGAAVYSLMLLMAE